MTQAGARTGAVDPATGLVSLPTAELGPPKERTAEHRAGHTSRYG